MPALSASSSEEDELFSCYKTSIYSMSYMNIRILTSVIATNDGPTLVDETDGL